jgi:chromosome partitioning protein
MIVTPFGRELKRLRAERNLTVRDLAEAIGKSVAYVAKIEVEGEVPSGEVICDLARVLNASPAEMLRVAKEVRLASVARQIDREYTQAMEAREARDSDSVSKQKGEDKMSTVVSLINMKGGVGKTTLAMHLAHIADQMDLRTLAVDLDPQANLSQALMGARAYVKHVSEKKPTVIQVFDEYLPPGVTSGSPRLLNVKEVVVPKAGFWDDTMLDLIPSRLELARTLKNPAGKERRLAKALAQVRKDYDLVIIDCAPTESVLTDAAYFASRYVVVPIKPEYMATIGLPLLARSINEFKLENDDQEIEIAGLVFNHSSSYSTGPEGQQSVKEVTKFAKENGWHICENQVRYSASYAKSAREHTPLSHTSHARSDVVRGFRRLAEELFGLIGVARKVAA